MQALSQVLLNEVGCSELKKVFGMIFGRRGFGYSVVYKSI